MKLLSDIQRVARIMGITILSVVVLFATVILSSAAHTKAASPAFILLSRYSQTLKIGQSFYLTGIASNGKWVRFTSSSSRIASVNTYGKVTAKKAGTCTITGKVSGGEASCRITVQKTSITLSAASITMENGARAVLKGETSNGSSITWKSQKTSVAVVSENGEITAKKPGETTITAIADSTKKTCRLFVKKPKVTLNRTSSSLYRGQTIILSAKVSSGRKVSWKSQKSSVATVDDTGKVTAKKHGTAIIRASVDGVTKECEITVKSPVIKLNRSSVTIRKGKTCTLKADVSSGNKPVWKSSRSGIASVNANGVVTAKKIGSCVITVSEDGTKKTCHIQVKK